MQQGFILTRDWREGRTGLVLEFWVKTPDGARLLVVGGEQSVCFFEREHWPQLEPLLASLRGWHQQPVALTRPGGEPVNALYFQDYRVQRELVELADGAGVDLWETDIRPTDRYLMERFITADVQWHSAAPARERQPVLRLQAAQASAPSLRCLSLDIETSMDGRQLFSIGLYGDDVARVYMVGDCEPQDDLELISCRDQRDCLDKFLRALRLLDPDILIGWNLVGFDLWMLSQFCVAQNLKFAIGRQGAEPRWREDAETERRYIHIPGRVALDGIDWLKAASYQFESFSLNHVSRELLGDSKLLTGGDRGHEIGRLFHEDKLALARYNLHDCKLVADIFEKTRLLEFVVARARLTGLPLDRVGGSVAAFEFSYLPRLHRAGFVAPNLGELESDIVSPGGYVMESRPGLYADVLVLDFKSLYPSIIRTFLIDPCGFWKASLQPESPQLPGFNGAVFARDGHLLPGLIEHLWRARDQAKRDQDAPLSQAIKILMNSFYGVLGSEGCRFFDPRMCSSITLRGHEIIQRSRQWIEGRGYPVIYGDTDSLFVWLNDQSADAKTVGAELAKGLNHWWCEELQTTLGLTSALEIEFETHFEKFFMPTIRGSDTGSKKRYAGIVKRGGERELVFKGLEAVRTDWTRLARDFQRELYWRLFEGLDWKPWLREQVDALRRGARDEDLVYRKRLRRRLADYTKTRPPHVQAALRLPPEATPRRGDWVEYLITVNGPEPLGQSRSPIDYQHYLDRQIRPVADAILSVYGEDFDALVGDQLNLF